MHSPAEARAVEAATAEPTTTMESAAAETATVAATPATAPTAGQGGVGSCQQRKRDAYQHRGGKLKFPTHHGLLLSAKNRTQLSPQ